MKNEHGPLAGSSTEIICTVLFLCASVLLRKQRPTISLIALIAAGVFIILLTIKIVRYYRK